DGVPLVYLHECVREDCRDADPSEPLAVGGYDVPGRPPGARSGQHLGERLLVGVPVLALLDVVRGELPVLVRQVDPSQEPATLFLLREVQEDLDDLQSLVVEVALPLVDLVVPPLPDVLALAVVRDALVLEQLRVNTDDENLLVVRAVEDADVTSAGQSGGITPEIVVIELLRTGSLEAVDVDALRVDAAHDVTDG